MRVRLESVAMALGPSGSRGTVSRARLEPGEDFPGQERPQLVVLVSITIPIAISIAIAIGGATAPLEQAPAHGGRGQSHQAEACARAQPRGGQPPLIRGATIYPGVMGCVMRFRDEIAMLCDMELGWGVLCDMEMNTS